MQETQSDPSLDREPLADSVRYCELCHCVFLLSSRLDDGCLYSCMVAAQALIKDFPSCSCNELILFNRKCFPAVKHELLSGRLGLPPGPSGSLVCHVL